MKIKDKIPGEQLDIKYIKGLTKKIEKTLNPNNLESLEMWKELKRINKKTAIDYYKKNKQQKYYMLYTVYGKNETNYIFLTNKDDIIKFIDNEFDEEYDEGFDIIITDIEFKKIIMGNHDGILVTR